MTMETKWILNDRGVPEPCPDLVTWATWFEEHHPVTVGDEFVGKIRVMTFFLAVAAPRLEDDEFCFFETAIIGGSHDGLRRRYPTREEAIEGHRKLVDALTCGDLRPLQLHERGILGMFAHLMEEKAGTPPPSDSTDA